MNQCGAHIEGHGTHVIKIQGVEELSGCEYEVISDRIEAGTYLVAGAITRGNIEVRNAPVYAMDGILSKLQEMGVDITINEDRLILDAKDPINCVDIITQPYPGFPTDMQAQFMALCVQLRFWCY